MKRILTFFATLLLTSSAHADGAWIVSPDFKDGRKDISGAACGPARCLAVNDETHRAQEFSLEQGRITPGRRIKLLKHKVEIDAEAITYTDGAFYIAGSHGLSRKSGKFRPAQFLIFRVDGETITRTDRLRNAVRRAPFLTPHAEKRLNKNGVNIEGMAAQGDRLFFGFRGPSVRNQAFVLEVSATALFSDRPLDQRTHILPLGPRIGIRDMAQVSGGILILTGPVNTLPRAYTIALWTPDCGVTRVLSEIPVPAGGKPEGLLIHSESQTSYTVLIFHDGAANGAPTQQIVPKS